MFNNKNCYEYHRQTQNQEAADGRAMHRFMSICQKRRRCKHCHRIIYERDRQRKPELLHRKGCPKIRRARFWQSRCWHCGVRHGPAQPYCFIQPTPWLEEWHRQVRLWRKIHDNRKRFDQLRRHGRVNVNGVRIAVNPSFGPTAAAFNAQEDGERGGDDYTEELGESRPSNIRYVFFDIESSQ